MDRMRWALVGFILAAACLAEAPPVRGEDASWVGKRIVLTKRGVKIGHTGNDGKIHDDVLLDGMVYTVEEEQGDWLQVCRRGVSGWFARSDAVLLEQADAYFTDRIQKDAKDDFLYGARGSVSLDQGDMDAAINDFDEAIRLSPQDPAWLWHRGECWYDKRDFEKAIADLDEVVRLDPNRPEAFLIRGWVWYGKGDYDKAMTDLDEAVRLAPKWPDAFVQRGNAWLARWESTRDVLCTSSFGLGPRDEFEKAIADYNEAVRLDPARPETFVLRGDAWFLKGEYDKAIADYSEAIRVDPRNAAPSLNGRARLLATCPDEKFRDGKKAFADAQKACELADWKDTDYLDTLAAACAEMGEFTEAVLWQTRVVDSLSDAKKPVEDAQKRLDLYKDHKPYRHE